jgi:hypothetical protein
MFQDMLLRWGICYPKMHCLMWFECLRMAVAMGIQCAWSGPVAWPRYEITGKRRWRCGSAEHLWKLTFFGLQYVQMIMYVWLRMYNYVCKILSPRWLYMIMSVWSCMYDCVCIIMCVRFFWCDFVWLCMYDHVCIIEYV